MILQLLTQAFNNIVITLFACKYEPFFDKNLSAF